jgi:hypothetical protein
MAHRAVLAATLGRPLSAAEVTRHLCHRRDCVNPAHLAVGAQADNVRDMVLARRHRVGERKPGAKLTCATVAQIRRRIAAGERPAALAREHRVSPNAIYAIRDGRKWRIPEAQP